MSQSERYFYPLDEYLRPWKIVALAIGLLFLFAGALWSNLPDWDIGISLVMALPAYLTAAPSLRVVLEHRWRQLPYATFWTWLTVDGTYWAYWSWVNPAALELRHANAFASLALYGMCGLVWYARRPLFPPTYDDYDWLDEDQHH